MSTSPVVGQLHVLSHMRGEKELLYILTQAGFFFIIIIFIITAKLNAFWDSRIGAGQLLALSVMQC